MDEKREVSQPGMTDMTQGSPAKLIFAFALPLLAGNMFQQLYNMVDSMVVGNYVGKNALAAVGTGFPVIFMLSALFMGMGSGATVMVGQYYGAGEMEKVKKTIDTSYIAILAGAIPLSVVGILLSAPLLRMMNTPAGETFDLAWLYMAIIFGGIIGTLGYNINAGVLQGLGDSKTPLLFLAIACGLNIVLDLVFVLVFHWGVAGVAIATIIAQVVSWLFGLEFINKKYPELRLRLGHLKFDREIFAQVLRLGVPAGIQQAVFSIGIMVLQGLVNSYGPDFMAGFNGANKLDTFAFMPVQSFSMAATTFAAQNIGAGRMDRVRSGTVSSILLACGFSIAAAVMLVPMGPLFMKLFSPDPAVIAAGMAYLDRVMPFYCLVSILFVLNAIMRGAGEMMIPMISVVLSLWLVRVPAAYLFAHLWGRDNMFYCYAAGWVLGVLISGGYYLSGRWKDKGII